MLNGGRLRVIIHRIALGKIKAARKETEKVREKESKGLERTTTNRRTRDKVKEKVKVVRKTRVSRGVEVPTRGLKC